MDCVDNRILLYFNSLLILNPYTDISIGLDLNIFINKGDIIEFCKGERCVLVVFALHLTESLLVVHFIGFRITFFCDFLYPELNSFRKLCTLIEVCIHNIITTFISKLGIFRNQLYFFSSLACDSCDCLFSRCVCRHLFSSQIYCLLTLVSNLVFESIRNCCVLTATLRATILFCNSFPRFFFLDIIFRRRLFFLFALEDSPCLIGLILTGNHFDARLGCSCICIQRNGGQNQSVGCREHDHRRHYGYHPLPTFHSPV